MQAVGVDRPKNSHSDAHGAVLTKAVVRAAEYLDLPSKMIGQVIGVSDASVSRMKTGAYVVTPGTKQFELAQYLVRLFRSLDAITGGDDAASRSWLRTDNRALGDKKPIDLIVTVQGLLTVLSYVDSRRAPL